MGALYRPLLGPIINISGSRSDSTHRTRWMTWQAPKHCVRDDVASTVADALCPWDDVASTGTDALCEVPTMVAALARVGYGIVWSVGPVRSRVMHPRNSLYPHGIRLVSCTPSSWQRLTLVHSSAQRKRFYWDKGCLRGVSGVYMAGWRGCLGG